MGILNDIVEGVFGDGGRQASADSLRASELAARGDRESLAYLQETEALPLEIRNEFLPQLADVARGGQGQQTLIDSAMNSPLYQSIMGGQQVGEDAIMRNAAMTGGLRSGNVSGDLTDYGSQLQNQALLQSYNQQLSGIQGLAGIPLNTNAIAQATGAESQTLSQGLVASSQARQQGQQNRTNSLMGLGGAALMFMSDIRLKDNIKYLGVDSGHNVYSWKWNEEAEKLGLKGETAGVMAHEIAAYLPEAISTQNGYIMVDYSMLTKRAA